MPTGCQPETITKSAPAAFVLLCMANCLDISQEDAVELLTEGGNDAGVDGLHIDEVDDGEFLVTVFQGKYKINNLDGTENFPENGVQKAVNTVQILFDPFRQVTLNERLAPKVEEIRSLIRDTYIPRVRFMLCNNGAKWNAIAQGLIDEMKKDYPDKVEFYPLQSRFHCSNPSANKDSGCRPTAQWSIDCRGHELHASVVGARGGSTHCRFVRAAWRSTATKKHSTLSRPA